MDVDVALLQAAADGGLSAVERALADGANADDARDEDGKTALMKAAARGHVGIVQALVAAGADVNEVYAHIWTPLKVAMTKRRMDVVQALVRAGADVCLATGPGRVTPLAFAADRGYADMTELFLQVDGVNVDHIGWNGNTALLTAVFSRSYDTMETVTKLLVAGANVHHVNNAGETALMRAARAGNLDIMELLLCRDVAVDHTDATGSSALLHASRCGHIHVVERLLRTGQANVDVANNNVEMARCVAAKHACADVVEVLLAWGAVIQHTVRDGAIVCEHSDANITTRLNAAGADLYREP